MEKDPRIAPLQEQLTNLQAKLAQFKRMYQRQKHPLSLKLQQLIAGNTDGNVDDKRRPIVTLLQRLEQQEHKCEVELNQQISTAQ